MIPNPKNEARSWVTGLPALIVAVCVRGVPGILAFLKLFYKSVNRICWYVDVFSLCRSN